MSEGRRYPDRKRLSVDRSRFEYQPALDGLRALAVVAVLLFHGGVSWMPGGYVGVSVFFTLSGYLITALLLRELATRGSIGLGAFYARRARRLLPAGVLCLVGVVAASWLGAFVGVADLQRDVLGAVFQVANWTELLSGRTYGDLLQAQAGQVSPLAHYWSLAIEEQFYWLWPLVLGWLAARRADCSWSRSVGALTVVAIVLAPAIAWRFGPDAAYWATPARAAEILLGATLACLCMEGRLPAPPRWVAPVGLGVLAAAVVLLPAREGLAYQGGLPLVALASAGLIYGLQGAGPVRTALTTPALVGIGKISYGLYLFHWPLYAWLDEAVAGTSGASLLALRLVLTLDLAALSYLLVEQPTRSASWRPRTTLVLALPALTLVAVLATTLVPDLTTDFGPAPEAAAQVAIQPVPADQDLDPIRVHATRLSRPVRIEVIGDSTAAALGTGMVAWAAAHPDLAQVTVRAGQGCGFVRSGVVPTDPAASWPQQCDDLFARLADDLTRDRPDVVLLKVSSRDLDPRSWDGGPLLTMRDLEFRQRVAADYRAITDLILTLTPATVVWVRPMVADPYWSADPDTFHNPELHALLDGVRAGVVASYSDRVELLDLGAWAEDTGLDQDRTVRPDGVHLSIDAALAVTTEWLGPQMLAAPQARCRPGRADAELPSAPSGATFLVHPAPCS